MVKMVFYKAFDLLQKLPASLVLKKYLMMIQQLYFGLGNAVWFAFSEYFAVATGFRQSYLVTTSLIYVCRNWKLYVCAMWTLIPKL